MTPADFATGTAPAGPGWPLRGYELALLISQHAYDMSADLELTLVEPDPPSLALAGDRAVQLVAAELARAQARVVSANRGTNLDDACRGSGIGPRS